MNIEVIHFMSGVHLLVRTDLRCLFVKANEKILSIAKLKWVLIALEKSESKRTRFRQSVHKEKS